MNLLAFDTSTDTLRAAVTAGGSPIAVEAPGGAQASVTLLPLLRDLMAQAGLQWHDLAAIVFGRGPGSFTGLRTACSVAQGLAFGANLPVLPVDTLLAVAEDARARHGAQRVVATLDARMDQVYWGRYQHDGQRWQTPQDPMLSSPEEVLVPAGWQLAGNAAAVFGARLAGSAAGCEAAPSALALLRLAPGLLAAGQAVPAARATPLYIRDKVAQTTEERAAARAERPA